MPLVRTFPPRRRRALPNGGEAFLTLPRAPGPIVVLLHEIFGINDHIKELGDGLAREGFLVVTPALFHRTAPDLRLGYSPTDIAVGRVHKDRTTRAQLIADIADSVALAQAEALAQPGAWSTLGFCFGGLVAMLAAGALAPASTVACYGANAPRPLPDGSPSVLSGPAPAGRVLVVWGGKDTSIPAADQAALTAAWPAAQVHIEEDAAHGFLCDARESYVPEAAARTWPIIRSALRAPPIPT